MALVFPVGLLRKAVAGTVNTISFTGGSGALTGNQVATAHGSSDLTGMTRDGSGNVNMPTAATSFGQFRALGTRGDCTITCPLGATYTGFGLSIIFCASADGSTYYCAELRTGNEHIDYYKNGSFQTSYYLDSGSNTNSVKFAVKKTGGVISAYVNDVLQVNTYTDGSPLSDGYVGLGNNGNASGAKVSSITIS